MSADAITTASRPASAPGSGRPAAAPATLAVVTVLYNSDNVLAGFFASLARQRDVPFRLYVLDNSPSDTGSVLSEQLAAQYGLDAVVTFNNANLGVATANNQGIAQALADGCELVLLANNDIEFEDPLTFQRIIARLRASGAAAASPKIDYFDTGKIWCYGGYISLLRASTPHYQQGRADVGQLDHLKYIEYASTCFMLVPRSTFEAIGTMDEKYFVYYDDTDFVMRMQRAGLKIAFVPECRILHKVSSSTGGDVSPFSLYYGTRNRLYFSRKHLHGLQQWTSLAVSLVASLAKALRAGAAGRSAVWRGMRDGFRV